jgi:hypothetical protein
MKKIFGNISFLNFFIFLGWKNVFMKFVLYKWTFKKSTIL